MEDYKTKDTGDIMPTIIENIISVQTTQRTNFARKQHERLSELRAIQSSGKISKAQRRNVINKLKRAGVLNEKGELAERYRKDYE